MHRIRPARHDRERERGQILVLFALSAIALIAMVGLVLDGGGAFAQRREEQNGADLAALAGANAYMNTPGTPATRIGRGDRRGPGRGDPERLHERRGWRHWSNVSVTLPGLGRRRHRRHRKPHRNSFAPSSRARRHGTSRSPRPRSPARSTPPSGPHHGR